MKNVLGNKKISISREISKRYEEIYRGSIEDVILELDEVKGEIVLVVEGNNETETYDDISIIDQVKNLIGEGYTSKEAIKEVAHLRGLNKNIVYQEYHRGD